MESGLFPVRIRLLRWSSLPRLKPPLLPQKKLPLPQHPQRVPLPQAQLLPLLLPRLLLQRPNDSLRQVKSSVSGCVHGFF
jgi:hypothetical protein